MTTNVLMPFSFWTRRAPARSRSYEGGWPSQEKSYGYAASVRPLPLFDLGLIDAMLVGVVLAVDLPVAQLLLGVGPGHPQGGHAVDDVHGQAEAVNLVLDSQIKRRVDVPLFLVAAYVDVRMIGAPVGQAMDQRRIAVEIEDDRLINGEQTVEVPVREAVRVLAGGQELVQVHHVDEAYLQRREVLPQQCHRRQRLFGGNIPGAGQHHVRLRPLVVADRGPDANT